MQVLILLDRGDLGSASIYTMILSLPCVSPAYFSHLREVVQTRFTPILVDGYNSGFLCGGKAYAV